MSSVIGAARPGTSRPGVLFEVSEFISRSNHLLDEELFIEWIGLTAQSFHYDINTYSPEILGHVVLMEKNRNGLQTLFDQLTMHERYPDKFRRITGASCISRLGEDGCDVSTPLSVFHTNPAGATALYCVGRYFDQFSFAEDRLALAVRSVVLDTRRLPFGSHVPI